MGLQPLEFSDCISDSPYFREKLHTHEKELERTNKAIKALIAECKEVLNATRALSKAQRIFSQSLTRFKFDCMGNDQTDEEKVIECSLQEFGKLISSIEDERDKLLDQATNGIIQPLENFRKDQLGAAKEGKKKFDKETQRYCTSLERYLNQNPKQNDSRQDVDNQLELEKNHFYKESMNYVLKLQEVQEKKKFEFVEILLMLMYRLMTFYHTGHEVADDFRPYLDELRLNIQRCRANFDTTREEAVSLMNKMLSQKQEPTPMNKTCTREGYIFLREKKALGTTWTKYFCMYQKENKILTMIPYSQVTGKGVSGITTETMMVTSCIRRASDTIDKRFCFDLTVQDKQSILTLQALSEEDRRLWMDAMDGKEPIYQQPNTHSEVGGLLDDIGFSFIKRCILCLDDRGLEEQGLYRIVGVGSRVNKLTNMGLDRRKLDKLDLSNEAEWETKTITSAIKNYFRNLPEPLLTYKWYKDFIQAAKCDTRTLRINEVHELVHKLPDHNFEMLKLLMDHLSNISAKNDQNLMTIGNLGVCFGPTLMRSPEESLASIMDIKWCNLVVEILIDNYEKIFKTAPQFAELQNTRVLTASQTVIPDHPSTTTTNSNMTSSSTSNNHQQHHQHSKTAAFSHPHMGQPPPPRPGHVHGAHAVLPPGVSHAAPSQSARMENMSPRHQSDYTYQSPPSVNSSLASSASLTASMNNSNIGSPQMYANMTDSNSMSSSMSRSYDGGLTYAQYKNQTRPKGGFYSQYSVWSTFSGDHPSSASSSTESLNSKCSGSSATTSQSADVRRPMANIPSKGHVGHVAQAINRFSQGPGQPPGSLDNGGANRGDVGKKVRTLYSCDAENETELSFEPNEIILNVRPSREPGWLEGSLNGLTGLIPANYVEYLN